MFDSQLYRKLWLVTGALGLLTVAGCANQPATVAGRHAANAASGAPAKAAIASLAGNSADPGNATQPLQLVTLPEGTPITATVEQTLTSDKNHWGDAFTASIAKPVKVDGKVILPRGTQVTGRVQKVKKHELKVVLASIVVHGVYCDLATDSRRPSDKDRPKGQKRKKDNSVLSAKTRLTFTLSKSVTVPVQS